MEQEKKKEGESFKKLVAVNPSVDFPVDIVATETDPYHETGSEFQVGTKKAKELVKRGWAKMAMIALIMFASLGAVAQQIFYNALGTNLQTDTVINAGQSL